MSRVDDLFRSDFHISAKSRLEIVQERITHRLFLLRFEKEPVGVIPNSGENRTRRVSNHIRPIMLQSFPQIIERRDRKVARASDYYFFDLRTLSACMERFDSLLIGVRNCL